MSGMRRRVVLLQPLLIMTSVVGALGFVLVYWLFLTAANSLGGVSQLRESIATNSMNLWIWSTPYPKPYDVHVYLLTVFGMAGILVWVSARFARAPFVPLEATHTTEMGLRIAAICLPVLLVSLFGQYPDDMRTSYFWTVKTLTGTRYALVIVAAVMMVSFPYVVGGAARNFARSPQGLPMMRWAVWAFVLLVSFLSIYEPGYPLQILHDAGYLAPIHQVLSGRTIYKDVASQYLFMGAYPLALLAKMGILAEDYRNFMVLLTMLWVVQLSVLFALVRKATRSDYWGLMCVCCTISVSILSPWLSPVGIPNTGPLRWMGFFLLPLLMAHLGYGSRVVVALLVLMIFGAIDVGIQATAAYAVYRVIALSLDWRRWRRALEDTILFGFLASAMLGLLQLFMLTRTGQLLHLHEVFYTIERYSYSGFGMVPLMFRTPLYLLVAVNLSAIVFAALAIRRDANGGRRTPRMQHAHLLLFSSCLALVATTYYVGRSTDGNLFNVAQFTMVPLFLLLPFLRRHAMPSLIASYRPALATHLLVASLLIGLPIVGGRIYVGEKLERKIQAGVAGMVKVDDVLSPFIDQDVALIRRSFAAREAVLWLGNDAGTFVLARTNHPFLLYFSPHRWALTTQDLRSDLDRVAARGLVPNKIVVECTDAIRYSLARKAGLVFATYDRSGLVHPTNAHDTRRADHERFRTEARKLCQGRNPARYNAFLPNDFYQDKWNQLFNFAEAASAAFGVEYTLDIASDCSGHNCVLVRAQFGRAERVRQ